MEKNEDQQSVIRLSLAIAKAGLASRRHAEEIIAAGRVSVNGETVNTQGVKVDPSKDKILVDGKPLPSIREETITVMLHKPRGFLSAASDGHGGRLVTELVSNYPGRLVPVGRLDKDSSGLLLLSNDGELIKRLTHPRYGHRKVYRVEVSGIFNDDILAELRSPMEIDGYLLKPVDVTFLRSAGRHTFLRFVLHEGRNRQIRKMCATVGLNVVSLMRIAIDNLQLGDLRVGESRLLTDGEIKKLMR